MIKGAPSARARLTVSPGGHDLGVHLIDLLVHVRDLQLGLQIDLVLDIVTHPLARDLAVLAEQHEH